MILAFATALAHHGTTPSQVVPEVQGRPLAEGGDRVTLGFGLGWLSTAHHAVLRDGRPTDNAQGTRITTHALTATVRLGLPTGTGVALSMPVGGVLVRTTEGRSPHLGPGDLTLRIDQRLGPVALFVGGTAPTGTTADATVQMTDVVAKGSELALQSYDTRASLGTGAWTTLAGASFGGRLQSFAGDLGTWGQLPLGPSRDGVRWGATVGARGAAGIERGPITAQGTLTVRHHLPDRWEDTEDGPSTGGRRSLLAAGAAVQVRPTDDLVCMAHARLPVWRAAQGTQLVESFQAGASCTVQLAL